MTTKTLAKDDIPVQFIMESFYLDDHGNVRNLVSRRKARAHEIAGFIHWSNAKNPYRKALITNPESGKKRNFRTHRLAWVLRYGRWPEISIDHRNHDGLNNHPENLRQLSFSENSKNRAIDFGVHAWRGGFYFSIIVQAGCYRSDLFPTRDQARLNRDNYLISGKLPHLFERLPS